MYQVEERSEKKVFHDEDFVLWHCRSGNRLLPIPGIVVRQEEHNVIIRARMDGKVKELSVDPSELVER